MELIGDEILDYACARFQEGKYDEALEAFVLAYSKGCQREWVLENIYSCYMSGNEAEFQDTYRQAGDSGIPYEACLLDFIPYREGEYFIFDKGLQEFCGTFSMSSIEDSGQPPELEEMPFSAVAAAIGWDWREDLRVMTAAGRKVYVVCHDRSRSCSFYKIPELKGYWKNIMLFSDFQGFQDYFHRNTAEYLPRILFGMEKDARELERIIDEEHAYRLTPEGRNESNVLLTIGIPTHDRGNLLLKRIENLRGMAYDAEIEVAISKNGSSLYQEEYEKAAEVLDARMHYMGCDEELWSTVNWHRVAEMAHGKYVLFVSDEDDVILEALEHYLKLLTDHPEASLVRAKTTKSYSHLAEGYGRKGLEAFELMFTAQNYLSGLIVRREDFLEENLLKLEQHKENEFYKYYPHEWWCALLTRKGDAMTEPVTLIAETDSVLGEEVNKLAQMGKEVSVGFAENTDLPIYATYESRLLQFQGCVEFLHWFMEASPQGAELGMGMAIGKTQFLLNLARKYQYKPDRFLDVVDEFARLCMAKVEEFPFDEGQKMGLLRWFQDCCLKMLRFHGELNAESDSGSYAP